MSCSAQKNSPHYRRGAICVFPKICVTSEQTSEPLSEGKAADNIVLVEARSGLGGFLLSEDDGIGMSVLKNCEKIL